MSLFDFQGAPRWERFLCRFFLEIALQRLRRGMISGSRVYPNGWRSTIKSASRAAWKDFRSDDFVSGVKPSEGSA